MANLDDWGKGNETNQEMAKATQKSELGQKVSGKLKGKAKGLVKKGTKKVKDKLGADGLKQTAKGAGKVLQKAAKSTLKHPATWVVLALVFLLGGSGFTKSMSSTEQEMLVGGVPVNSILTEDGELSGEGVSILMSDCPELKVAEDGTHLVDKGAAKEANAKLVYSVFKSNGLSDEMIAGILGNMEHETEVVDPTCIEGIYNEPNQVGPRKQAAFADLDAWTTGTIFPKYEENGISISKAGYQGPSGKYYCGIGLIQWTGEGAEQILTVAQGLGRNWYDMDFQLAYMLSDAYYRKGFFAKWKAEPAQTVSEAAYYFAKWYEGNTSHGAVGRIEKAEAWYPIIQSWTVDSAYANSITALAGSMGLVETDNALAAKGKNCGTSSIGQYDNSSMAAAMVSYAYPSTSEAHNDGTAIYQQVHRYIFPGDSYFKSCDRSVACAVRWSGSDDTYPKGNTDYQLSYLRNSDKWESVGMAGSLTMADLQPGDVFCVSGHTFMYVGTELIQRFHPGANPSFDTVSGSLEDYSPGCCAQASEIIGRGGMDWNGHGEYEVFRCVKPDNSETYQAAGGAAVVE